LPAPAVKGDRFNAVSQGGALGVGCWRQPTSRQITRVVRDSLSCCPTAPSRGSDGWRSEAHGFTNTDPRFGAIGLTVGAGLHNRGADALGHVYGRHGNEEKKRVTAALVIAAFGLRAKLVSVCRSSNRFHDTAGDDR
jgi:hypothetical protein